MPSMAPAGRSLAMRSTMAVSLQPPASAAAAIINMKRKGTLSVDPIQGENKWAKMWRHGGRDMKLFGGKKGDDKAPMQGDSDEAGYYDSPVETVSLSDTRGSTNRGGATSSGSSAAGQMGGNANKVVVDHH